MEFILYALVGAASGVMAGLFGIGGGLIIVPVLLLVFETKGYSIDISAHMAVATSLAAIVFSSASAAYSQYKRQAIAWHRWVLVPVLMIGSIIGAKVVDYAPGNTLRFFLAVFLLVTATLTLKDKGTATLTLKDKGKEEQTPNISNTWISQTLSLSIGFLSAVVGIAGGTFLVPLLSALGHPIRIAVGTSSALGVPLVSMAAIGHVWSSYDTPSLPNGAFGYVYLPALIGITLISPWTAKLGVRLAHCLDPLLLRRCFAIFLLVSAVLMFYRLITSL